MTGAETTIDAHLLRQLNFFDELDDQQLKKIAPLFESVSLAADSELFSEGEQADYLYILLAGRVSLAQVIPGRSRRQTVVSTLSRGQLLGWSALLPDSCWQASAHTLKPCRLLRVAAVRIREVCEKDCAIGYLMMKKALAAVGQRLADSRLQQLDIYGQAND